VAIYGDYNDFDGLYDALYNIVGDENEFEQFSAARFRVLIICYEFRQALLGRREIEFVDNGMDQDIMKLMTMIAPEKNVYYKFYVLWPEMLFVMMALNDFIWLYAKKKARTNYYAVLDKRNLWDENIAWVRSLQAAAAKCIKDIVSDTSFKRMMNMINKDNTWVDSLLTQYVDILNCRFLKMNNKKRLKNIPVIARSLAGPGDEYRQIRDEIMTAARKYSTTADNISLEYDYPEQIEW
jgi:hypothetical protein